MHKSSRKYENIDTIFRGIALTLNKRIPSKTGFTNDKFCSLCLIVHVYLPENTEQTIKKLFCNISLIMSALNIMDNIGNMTSKPECSTNLVFLACCFTH